MYIYIYLSVCGASERPTTVGRHLVRRSAGFPSEKYGRANDRSRQTRGHVRHVRFDVHDKSGIENGTANEETFHKVRLPFVFVCVLFKYVHTIEYTVGRRKDICGLITFSVCARVPPPI